MQNHKHHMPKIRDFTFHTKSSHYTGDEPSREVR